MISTAQTYSGGNFRPSNQNSNNLRQHRPFAREDYSNNNNIPYKDYKATSPYQSDQGQSRKWGINNNYSRSPSTSRQGSSFTDFRRQPQSNSPNRSVFNRFGNKDPRKHIPYDKKFPTSKDGHQPNGVRFTTTDDSINELSGLFSLNS